MATSWDAGVALPQVGEHLILSTPAPHVLQVKMNRPRQLNAMSHGMEMDMRKVFDWFEETSTVWVAILTGAGRAFCAGQDLKSFLEANESEDDASTAALKRMKNGGFGNVSTRRLSKPIIAAVDGFAMGGGTELVLNCDLVVATSRSTFALPEVARGVVAAMGGIARIADIAGHQRASELLLTGRHISAEEARDRFFFVNTVVPVDKSLSVDGGQACIEAEAQEWAAKIVANSPDAVFVSKEGLNLARDVGRGELGIDAVTVKSFESEMSSAMRDGDNIREGVTAFFEKRKPAWGDPPILRSKPSSKL